MHTCSALAQRLLTRVVNCSEVHIAIGCLFLDIGLFYMFPGFFEVSSSTCCLARLLRAFFFALNFKMISCLFQNKPHSLQIVKCTKAFRRQYWISHHRINGIGQLRLCRISSMQIANCYSEVQIQNDGKHVARQSVHEAFAE